MKKRIVKIGLIVAVVCCIVWAIVHFLHLLNDGGDKVIPKTDFELSIQDRTENEIKGKDYGLANKAYQSIMGQIETEASITLANGTKKFSQSEIEKCKQIVFYEYAPIFAKYGNEYFKKSLWEDAILRSLKQEASNLQNMGIAEKGTSLLIDLGKIVTNVDGNFAAWNVVNSASRCTSVSEIKTVIQKAENYKYAPLTNNTKLLNALNRVGDDAKEAVVSYIVRTGSNVVYNRRSYKDYTEWTSYYYNVEKLIEEFRNAGYGYPTDLSYIHNSLIEADKEMLAFYSERERIQNRRN